YCIQALTDRQDALKQAQEQEKAARVKCENFGELELDADPEVLKRLQGAREQFLAIIPDLQDVQAQLRNTRESARQLMREINPEWTESNLDRFDDSFATQQRIQKFDADFAERREQLTS